jgi:hypothetical protein
MKIGVIGRTYKDAVTYAEQHFYNIPPSRILRIRKHPYFAIEMVDGDVIRCFPATFEQFRGHRFDKCYVQAGINLDIVNYIKIAMCISFLPESEQITWW